MIENVSTQLTVFHCFAHCLLPGRAFASLYVLLFLEKEAVIEEDFIFMLTLRFPSPTPLDSHIQINTIRMANLYKFKGVTGWSFQIMMCILVPTIILILANSADLNEALYSGAFHLGFTVGQSIPVIGLINSSPT